MRTLLLLIGFACLSGCKERGEPTRSSDKTSKHQGEPRDQAGIDLRIDPGLSPATRYALQEVLDRGVPFQRTELLEAVRKGLVVATASGAGLQSATIHLDLKSNHVLA